MFAVFRQTRHTLLRAQKLRDSARFASKSRSSGHSDPRVETIRRALYPPNVRLRESPTGAWRRDIGRNLRKAIPSRQAHETIERAWLLRERHVRWQRNAEAERKFECMRKAMDELHKLDPKLYEGANTMDDPRISTVADIKATKTQRGAAKKRIITRLPGLFPREMRLPTDTPPRSGWNHVWKSPSV